MKSLETNTFEDVYACACSESCGFIVIRLCLVCIWSPGSDSQGDRLQPGSPGAIHHLPQPQRSVRGPERHVCSFPAEAAGHRGRALRQHGLL